MASSPFKYNVPLQENTLIGIVYPLGPSILWSFKRHWKWIKHKLMKHFLKFLKATYTHTFLKISITIISGSKRMYLHQKILELEKCSSVASTSLGVNILLWLNSQNQCNTLLEQTHWLSRQWHMTPTNLPMNPSCNAKSCKTNSLDLWIEK